MQAALATKLVRPVGLTCSVLAKLCVFGTDKPWRRKFLCSISSNTWWASKKFAANQQLLSMDFPHTHPLGEDLQKQPRTHTSATESLLKIFSKHLVCVLLLASLLRALLLASCCFLGARVPDPRRARQLLPLRVALQCLLLLGCRSAAAGCLLPCGLAARTRPELVLPP